MEGEDRQKRERYEKALWDGGFSLDAIARMTKEQHPFGRREWWRQQTRRNHELGALWQSQAHGPGCSCSQECQERNSIQGDRVMAQDEQRSIEKTMSVRTASQEARRALECEAGRLEGRAAGIRSAS